MLFVRAILAINTVVMTYGYKDGTKDNISAI